MNMEQDNNTKAPVLVRRFPFAIEAEIAQALLAEYGISSYIYDLNINACYVGAVSGVRLFVTQEDYEQAIEILNDK